MLNEPKLWYREVDLGGREYVNNIVRVYKRTLEYMNKVLQEFESEDQVLYNLEQAPAESSSYRFAQLDYKLYPKFREYIPIARDPYSNRETVFYTNQNTPPYTSYRLETQLYIESEVQPMFTGGVVKHIFVHRFVEPENVRKLITAVAENTKIVYYSYTPTQSVCLRCGYRTVALIWECPVCGSTDIEHWSRVVGYYRPVRSWNPGRRAEFALRRSML